MRFLLLVIIGVLVYNSNDARFFISDQLNNASEIIRPDAQFNFRYWSWIVTALKSIESNLMAAFITLSSIEN